MRLCFILCSSFSHMFLPCGKNSPTRNNICGESLLWLIGKKWLHGRQPRSPSRSHVKRNSQSFVTRMLRETLRPAKIIWLWIPIKMMIFVREFKIISVIIRTFERNNNTHTAIYQGWQSHFRKKHLGLFTELVFFFYFTVQFFGNAGCSDFLAWLICSVKIRPSNSKITQSSETIGIPCRHHFNSHG